MMRAIAITLIFLLLLGLAFIFLTGCGMYLVTKPQLDEFKNESYQQGYINGVRQIVNSYDEYIERRLEKKQNESTR